MSGMWTYIPLISLFALFCFVLSIQKPPEELLVKSFQKNSESLGQVRDLGWVLFIFSFKVA